MNPLIRTLGLLVALTTAAAAQDAPLPTVTGTVTKIDKTTEKITLNHAPIPNLDMGDMTGMVFRAADKAMLDQVKVGDLILFSATRVNGQITLVKVELAAKPKS